LILNEEGLPKKGFFGSPILILEILKISHHRKSYKLEVKTSIMGMLNSSYKRDIPI